MAQWATVEAMAQIRDRVNAEGQRPIRGILEQSFDGPALEAAISMLAGVVACPSLMFGTLPDDAIIEAAVDIVLRGADVRAAGRGSTATFRHSLERVSRGMPASCLADTVMS